MTRFILSRRNIVSRETRRRIKEQVLGFLAILGFVAFIILTTGYQAHP